MSTIGMCKSYLDGLISGTFPDPEDPTVTLCMTSPNMVALPHPVVNQQVSTRMYSDGSFGLGDHILHPQPFHATHRHLALCLAPDLSVPDSARAVLHQNLTRLDWDTSVSEHPDYGVILQPRIEKLRGESNSLISRFQRLSRREELVGTEHVPAYKSRRPTVFALTHFIGRLSAPATFPECVRVWATVQHIHLELLAWVDYMDIYRDLFYDPPVLPRPVDLNRIGAITFDHVAADQLFRVGLPTYFVRRFEEVNFSNVNVKLGDAEMKRLLETQMIVRVGHQAGNPSVKPLFEPIRASPEHPVIFHGLPTSITRIDAMNEWISNRHPLQRPRKDWKPSDVEKLERYGVYDLQLMLEAKDESAVSVIVTIPTAPPSPSPGIIPPTLGAPVIQAGSLIQPSPPNAITVTSTAVRAPGTERSHGHRGRSKRSKAPNTPRRNKWNFTCEHMPEPIDVWQAVATAEGQDHNESMPSAWPNATEGWKDYGVPEPGMIASLPESQRRQAILNWCRLREVVKDFLEMGHAFKTSAWRTIMTFSGPANVAASTSTSKQRLEVLDTFNKATKSVGNNVQPFLDGLPQEAYWQNIRLDNTPLTKPIIQSVIGDINEMGFRQELCKLDIVLFDQNRVTKSLQVEEATASTLPATPLERRRQTLGRVSHFAGRYDPDLKVFYMKPRGFASGIAAEKCLALAELAGIMDDWVPKYRMDHNALLQLQALASSHHRDDPVLTTCQPDISVCERKVAETYINAFKDVYNRAPILPRSTYFPL
ncbi:hypothetical protein CYLTODRAFT_479154 [Cylindrobasidium torrendii FP15055 ss-10]|uniref:Uncharacterized protein n=1 Tax=Cylindrobasidium torrendii FP15055 ss-10 TaxID=1314674 RepID=A0A0D7AVJ3_9AGAR|nr:hypothetical protein CYLTODRAFT_479154 [Cylindrobasidium torrendii FP15055 ss-10]